MQAELRAKVSEYNRERELTEAARREREESLTAMEAQRRKLASKQVEQFRERVSVCVPLPCMCVVF